MSFAFSSLSSGQVLGLDMHHQKSFWIGLHFRSISQAHVVLFDLCVHVCSNQSYFFYFSFFFFTMDIEGERLKESQKLWTIRKEAVVKHSHSF